MLSARSAVNPTTQIPELLNSTLSHPQVKTYDFLRKAQTPQPQARAPHSAARGVLEQPDQRACGNAFGFRVVSGLGSCRACLVGFRPCAVEGLIRMFGVV